VGDYDQCYACRYPLSQDDMKSENIPQGFHARIVIIPIPQKIKSLTERQKQVILAKERVVIEPKITLTKLNMNSYYPKETFSSL
jgi:hypothetical protein